jgi:hypothetical protein
LAVRGLLALLEESVLQVQLGLEQQGLRDPLVQRERRELPARELRVRRELRRLRARPAGRELRELKGQQAPGRKARRGLRHRRGRLVAKA